MNDNSIKIDQVPLFSLKYSYFEKLDKDMQKQKDLSKSNVHHENAMNSQN